VMYLGGNYSFGVKAIGLMYGTGTVFWIYQSKIGKIK
jgi:hypothetical protein